MNRLLVTAAAAAVLLLSIPQPGAAQNSVEDPNFEVSVLAGAGGSLDANETGFGNSAYQFGFSVLSSDRTRFGGRLGRLDFSANDDLEGVFDASVTYLSAGGEYRAGESFWESGVFAGLGVYRLEGVRLNGEDVDETAIGGFAGVLGEFELTRRLAILVELSGHYVTFDDVSTFLLGQGGLAVRF